MKKAIILSRVSTFSQDLQQQTDKVKEQAIKDGYLEENIIIIEEKESAIKLKEDERLGLNRLKQYIEEDKEIDCVYVYELSRLSRRSDVSYSIREWLINRKIQIICLNPFFKLLDENKKLSDTGNIFWGIFTANAENEMMIKRERFKRGIERKKQLGKHHTGRILFGYTTEKDGTYIKHSVNSVIVRLCYELYLSGEYSTSKLASELQQRGYFKNCSSFTARNNVQTILHNEEYTGITGKPLIVTKTQFDNVKEMMLKNRNSEYRVSHNAICKGLLIDREKGYKLTLNAAGKCYFNTPRKCIWVAQPFVDDIVWNYVIDEHNRFHSMDRVKLINKLKRDYKEWLDKAMIAEDKLIECRKKIDLIEERYIMGKISEMKANEMENKIKEEIKLLYSQYDNAMTTAAETRTRLESFSNNDSIMPYNYETLSLNEKCKLTKEVISKIYCWKPKRTELCLEIHNKLTNEIFTYHLDSYHKKIITVNLDENRGH